MPQVVVEGWRALPVSFSVVNQFQCLEMLRRPELRLYHLDAAIPAIYSQGPDSENLFGLSRQRALSSIPPAAPSLRADATYRIFIPASIAPSSSRRTCVFGTTEYGFAPSHWPLPSRPYRDAGIDEDLVIVTPSEWSRLGFIRSGWSGDRVVVVPHGVDTSIFHPVSSSRRADLRRRLGWSGFVFLNVSTLGVRKGIDLLLRAFSEIVGAHPEATLVLKGLDDRSASKEIFAAATQSLTTSRRSVRMLERVSYVGSSLGFSALARLYQAADAYVSPYRAEGFNLPVLEALACRLPVICTKGGPTDDFTDEGTALTVESTLTSATRPGGTRMMFLEPSLEHLIETMKRVIERPDLAVAARRTGPAHVAERHTWRHVVDRLLEVLLPA